MINRILVLGALLLLLPAAVPGAGVLVDDRTITVQSVSDIDGRRSALIAFIWGKDGFPSNRQPDRVIPNIASPVRELSAVAQVDELRFALAPGLEGLGYHFIPKVPNNELVVLHHGHDCTLDDVPFAGKPGYGLQPTIDALAAAGYGVLGLFMPRMRPGDCSGGHEKLFALATTGSPLRFFLEPTAIGLNHVKHGRNHPGYRACHMVGLSGGGWTTTVYAAIDPTIKRSFPVAGTIPLYLRSGGSIGDMEQFLPAFYSLAGYPDLYVLGAQGKGRSQTQILVRRDDCCFGEAQHDAPKTGAPYLEAMRAYERRVQQVLHKAGGGAFRLEIDEVAPSHQISSNAIHNIILPGLRGKFQPAGARELAP